jgi:hypothetical protein
METWIEVEGVVSPRAQPSGRTLLLTPSPGFFHLHLWSTHASRRSVARAGHPMCGWPRSIFLPLGRTVRNPILFVSVAFLLLGPMAGCSGRQSGPSTQATIPRDTFVEAYYKLRVAALEAPGEEIDAQSRDSVLQSMGLTEEDLLHFVEVRGRNPQLMEGIWEQVDSLMRAAQNEPREGDPGGDDRP